MDAPVYSASTEDLYESLPQVHRLQDAAQVTPPFPLKKWLSGPGDQLGQVRSVIERLAFYTADEFPGPGEDVSALADADAADVAWLPWLGQLVGVFVDTASSEVSQRDQVRTASSGFKAGTRAALEGAVASLLTGSRYLRVDSHTVEVLGDGGEWDVRIITRASETPEGIDAVGEIIKRNAKPAGVLLHFMTYGASWDTIEGARPTWALWEGSSWTQIEETGLD